MLSSRKRDVDDDGDLVDGKGGVLVVFLRCRAQKGDWLSQTRPLCLFFLLHHLFLFLFLFTVLPPHIPLSSVSVSWTVAVVVAIVSRLLFIVQFLSVLFLFVFPCYAYVVE